MKGFILIVAGSCLFGIALLIANRTRGAKGRASGSTAGLYTDHRSQDDWSKGIPANPQRDAHIEASDMPVMEN